MRPSGDPEWFEHRSVVPLTGREPVLGQLRNRLRTRGPGWGWVTLHGPRGAGVTRLLDEAEAMLIAEGAPRPVRVRPRLDEGPPLSALRLALVPLFPGKNTRSLERALRTAYPASVDEVSALTAWLLGGEGATRMARPSPEYLRQFLEHLAGGGPVLVDDVHGLDAGTREVLLPSVDGVGPGVIAGVSGTTAGLPEDTLWSLEPLGDHQIELLLKRWLRHAATARRLTSELADLCEGQPGRVVEAVRSLGREGILVREPRGIVLKRQPSAWPAGRRRPEAFLQAASQQVNARRVLEVASLLAGFESLDIIADAAGVKRTYVGSLVAEATAARGGLEPNKLFATRVEREQFAARIPESRKAKLRERLAEVCHGFGARTGLALPKLLGHMHAQAVNPCLETLAQTLDDLLDSAPPAHQIQSWVLDLLQRAAEDLSGSKNPPTDLLNRVFLLFREAGRPAASDQIAIAVAKGPEPKSASATMLFSWAHHLEGHTEAAIQRLTLTLPDFDDAESPDEARFDAWALLGWLRTQAGHDPRQARAAWAHAGRWLDPTDLYRRASWHRGLATCARQMGRLSRVATHLRRAIPILNTIGHLRPSARALLSLGRNEVQRKHFHIGLDCLARAAHMYRVVADAEGEARTRFEIGRTYAACQAYDSAVEHLDSALRVARAKGLDDMLVDLHLSLALAHRGCGDLERERHHANLASHHAGAALARVRASAALAHADLRAGSPGAEALLERIERDLRAAGLQAEADAARIALFDVCLRSGESDRARTILKHLGSTPLRHLSEARLSLATGLDERALQQLSRLAADMDLPADVRAAAYAHLANAHVMRGKSFEARQAAVAGAALLEVTHRSRANDARLHLILARVFSRVGESGRSVGHRSMARRGMRRLVRAAADAREGRRLVRRYWRSDPRPRSNALSTVA